MTRIVIPAGTPILEAARWTGAACWAELRWHRTLTAWLAVELDDAAALTWWKIRSDRSALAEGWHQRLPSLREFPRSEFVEAVGPDRVEHFATWDGLDDPSPEGAAARQTAAEVILAAFAAGYHNRTAVAVGPADGPVAAWLAHALDVNESHRRWVAAWAPEIPSESRSRATEASPSLP